MMKIQVLVLAKVILAANFSNNFNALVSNSEYNLAPAEGRTTSDHCGFQLYDLVPGDKGWISTPNYPQGYPPNLKCIWWLKVKNYSSAKEMTMLFLHYTAITATSKMKRRENLN